MPIINFKDSDRKPRYNHASRKRRATERVDSYFREFFGCEEPSMSEEDIRRYVAKPMGKWMPPEEKDLVRNPDAPEYLTEPDMPDHWSEEDEDG